MRQVEVIARLRVRPGQLEGFTAQAAEIVRRSRELDTRTLRCDWYLDQEGTGCEVHEMFADERGLIEHQMHIMPARTVLFREFASDHRSTVYGEVSQDFINLVHERMGATPAVFSFLQGLDEPSAVRPADVDSADPDAAREGPRGRLEVHAHLKIRPGQREAFGAQAAEIMRLTREQDAHTLRYDWFLDEDGTECEVHEAYATGEGLIEHNAHVVEARAVLFERYAYDHRMTAFGEVSEALRNLADKHAGGIAVYSFLHGLEATAAV